MMLSKHGLLIDLCKYASSSNHPLDGHYQGAICYFSLSGENAEVVVVRGEGEEEAEDDHEEGGDHQLRKPEPGT